MVRRDLSTQEICRLYIDEKLSITQIAKILGTCPNTVHNRLRATNAPIRSPKSLETNLRHSEAIRREKSNNWKGGIRKANGYITIYAPEHPRANKLKYVPQHVLVWEQVHNKPLPQGWIVHHLNGVKNDNRPENLVGLPKQKHVHVLAAKAKRIRELEAKVKLLEKALDSQQLIFNVSEN